MALPKTRLLGSWTPGKGIDQDIEFYDDFAETSYTEGGGNVVSKYKVTTAGTPTTNVINSGLVLTAVTDAHSSEWQLNVASSADSVGGRFTPKAGKDLIFITKFTLSAFITTDFFVGIATWDDTVLDHIASAIGFCLGNGVSSLHGSSAASKPDLYAINKGGGQTGWTTNTNWLDTGKDIVNGQSVEVSFWVQGTDKITYYVNGNKVAATTTNIPASTVHMTPTFCIEGNGGVSSSLTMEYIYCAQKR